jgi:hypothetical protein
MHVHYPAIQSATSRRVRGTACPECTVELFVADTSALARGEGRRFVASGRASAQGTFSMVVTGIAVGQVVTATATDPKGNTSEFGRNVRVRPAS